MSLICVQDYVMDAAVEATGTEGIVQSATHATYQAQHYAHQGANIHSQFTHQNQHY